MAADAPPTPSTMRVHRWPLLAVSQLVARRAAFGALIWGAVFGLVVWVIAANFTKEYPTPESLQVLVQTMGSNVGLDALFGPSPMIDTVGGYVATHAIGVLGIIGAIWGLLAGTRLLRGEEDAGRWEVLLSAGTRRTTTAAALGGLGVAFALLWGVVAVVTVGVGQMPDAHFSVPDSLFMATATVAATAMFLAVGALCSQIAATRRQAVLMASAVFGIAFLLRMVAYSSTTLRWLRWVTPLGWVDEMRPLTGAQPWLLAPIVSAVVVLGAAAVWLAGRRDLGAGAVASADTHRARTRSLGGALGLAYRLSRGSALGWLTGLALGGFVVGVLVNGTNEIWANQSSGIIVRLGGAAKGEAYLGFVFLLFAFLVAMAAAGQVAATRGEEAEGYLDNLLGRSVGRLVWMTGRLGASLVSLILLAATIGVATWLGVIVGGADLDFGTMLGAGVNLVPVGVFVLGFGTLVHGVAPRGATVAAYAILAWSFLVEIIGAAIGASEWVLDLSVLHHVARAPAAAIEWDHNGILVALGLIAAGLGTWAFSRRDLRPA